MEERPHSPPHDPCASEADLARLRHDLEQAVHRVCPAWLRDEAEDLVHVALLRVMGVDRRSEGNLAFSSSYLKKAAFSAVVDEIRRRRRRREVALEEDGDGANARGEAPNPEERVHARETGRAIRDCLGRLLRPRKLAVTLHLLGFSVPEVADRLGWKAKKAENLVYRALADLRQCLDGKGMTP